VMRETLEVRNVLESFIIGEEIEKLLSIVGKAEAEPLTNDWRTFSTLGRLESTK
jgi:hypothetical protein